jgi:hypothetical protein
LSIVGQCIHIAIRYHKRNEESSAVIRKMMDASFPSVDCTPEDYVSTAVDFVTRVTIGGIDALIQADDAAATNDRGGR